MKREEIHEKLGAIFTHASSSEIEWSAVTDDTTIESLGFDSLTILDLLFEMEDALGVQVEASEILEVKTVGQMVDFLHERL
jgi:acyl carrier protein